MAKAMRYVVIRESIGFSRTHKDFTSEETAVEWASRHSTRAHIICKVYAVEITIREGVEEWPCSPNVRGVAVGCRVENVGTLIYYKRGDDIRDFRVEDIVEDIAARSTDMSHGMSHGMSQENFCVCHKLSC